MSKKSIGNLILVECYGVLPASFDILKHISTTLTLTKKN